VREHGRWRGGRAEGRGYGKGEAPGRTSAAMEAGELAAGHSATEQTRLGLKRGKAGRRNPLCRARRYGSGHGRRDFSSQSGGRKYQEER
jgi:hypothetical protein